MVDSKYAYIANQENTENDNFEDHSHKENLFTYINIPYYVNLFTYINIP